MDQIQFLTIFLGMFLFLIFMINAITKGFLFHYLIAKISNGKKKLIWIQAVGDSYFRTGIVTSGVLRYKNRNKERISVDIDEEMITHSVGVQWVITDETSNALIKKNDELWATQVTLQDKFKAVPGNYDGTRLDALLARALMAGMDEKLKLFLIIIMIGVGLVLILSLASVFFLNQVKQILLSGQLNVVCSNIVQNSTIKVI